MASRLDTEIEPRPVATAPRRASLWLILLALTAPPAAAAPRARPVICTPPGSAQGTVAAVDARLELTLGDGMHLAIAGVEPPLPTPDDPALAEKARSALAGWLVGHAVSFRPLAPTPDRWGRIPALVFAAAPGGTTLLSVGASLVDAGFARFRPSSARACDKTLLTLEAAARAATLGLWADPYYAVIAASDRTAFAKMAGTTVVVEGRLTSVEADRFRTSLMFGPRRGQDFSITIVQRNVRIFEAAGFHFHALIGRSFRVRGLLETRFGPRIEIASPDEIEPIDAGQSTSAPSPVAAGP